MNILNVDVISTKRIQKIILNQSLIISSPLESIVDQIIVSNTFRNPKYTEAVKFGRSCFGMPATSTHTLGRDAILLSPGGLPVS